MYVYIYIYVSVCGWYVSASPFCSLFIVNQRPVGTSGAISKILQDFSHALTRTGVPPKRSGGRRWKTVFEGMADGHLCHFSVEKASCFLGRLVHPDTS